MDSESEKNKTRCRQCNHLMSMHYEDGCTCWQLGIRQVQLYLCSCVVSRSVKPSSYPQQPLALPAQLSPVPHHIGEAVLNRTVQYDKQTNPEQVLSSLFDTLANRDILQDNDYTEFQRREIMALALTLQKLLQEIQENPK